MALTEDNYRSGPQPDERNRNQQIWVFAQKIDGIEVYIKLSIATVNKIKIAKCISFTKRSIFKTTPVR